MITTREDYYSLSGQRRRLVRELLAVWKELKAVRKRQGFAVARCRLIVKKSDGSADQTEAPLDWDEEVRRQIDESRRRFREQLQADADRYRRQKAEWKAHKKRVRQRFFVFLSPLTRERWERFGRKRASG